MKRRRWLAVCSGYGTLASRGVFAAATPGAPVDTAVATHFLPLFPLGVVAFPGEQVLLHVFEPRYKQLMAESAESGNSFGIVTIVPGGASNIGTEMRFDRLLRVYDDGKMDVTTRGLRVFRLKSFQREVEGKLYSGGQVSYLRNDPAVDLEIQNALVQLFNHMQYRAGSRRAITAPYPENLSFLIGHDVGMSQAEELQLLTMAVERDRQTYLFQHLLRRR